MHAVASHTSLSLNTHNIAMKTNMKKAVAKIESSFDPSYDTIAEKYGFGCRACGKTAVKIKERR
jgi:hypothetical protein